MCARRSGNEKPRHLDIREPFDRDHGRIAHSAAFRRLQTKTQVLGLGESDFYRTRLTHSVEVAEIAFGILRRLRRFNPTLPLPTGPLITAISLSHDIGHPPFGHGGEVALNYKMRDDSGFEGNAQTLRILTLLEQRTEKYGLDLTRRTLLGVLKYPASYSRVKVDYSNDALERARADGHRAIRARDWTAPKCYYDEEGETVEWILSCLATADRTEFGRIDPATKRKSKHQHHKAVHKALDTSIMDLADDVSYGVHDLEDAIHMGFIQRDDFDRATAQPLKDLGERALYEFGLDNLGDKLFGQNQKWRRKDAIGTLINTLIASTEVQVIDAFQDPLLRHRVRLADEFARLLGVLKELVSEKVIKSTPVQTLEYRGQLMVMELFDAFSGDPDRLLPDDIRLQLEAANPKRVIADYIAGMTDEYATRIYQRLFTPRQGMLLQKL